jgi:mycothiol system anti-sigma-R factor
MSQHDAAQKATGIEEKIERSSLGTAAAKRLRERTSPPVAEEILDRVACDDTLRHVWVYLDRQPDAPIASELEAHLAECASCQRVVRFDRKFKLLVRRCSDVGAVPVGTLESLRVRVQKLLAPETDQEPSPAARPALGQD